MLIREQLDRLTELAAINRRLFEAMGGLATDWPDADGARILATLAHHFAWHASLWEERVPVLHDAEATLLDVTNLDEVAAGPDPRARLASLVEAVLPQLRERYEELRAVASEVCDGPVLRALQLVLTDLDEDQPALQIVRGGQ